MTKVIGEDRIGSVEKSTHPCNTTVSLEPESPQEAEHRFVQPWLHSEIASQTPVIIDRNSPQLVYSMRPYDSTQCDVIEPATQETAAETGRRRHFRSRYRSFVATTFIVAVDRRVFRRQLPFRLFRHSAHR